jgi:hypothetical protein
MHSKLGFRNASDNHLSFKLIKKIEIPTNKAYHVFLSQNVEALKSLCKLKLMLTINFISKIDYQNDNNALSNQQQKLHFCFIFNMFLCNNQSAKFSGILLLGPF